MTEKRNKFTRADNKPLVLLKKGDTFKCGKNGRITGTIVEVSEIPEGDSDYTHGFCDPEDFGYIYTLDTDVIVYKAVRRDTDGSRLHGNAHVIKLLIPAGTKIRAGFRPARFSEYAAMNCSYKCRAEKAIVMSYRSRFPSRSDHDYDFQYVAGSVVKPPAHRPFNMNPGAQCAAGIHFFFSKDHAAEWLR